MIALAIDACVRADSGTTLDLSSSAADFAAADLEEKSPPLDRDSLHDEEFSKRVVRQIATGLQNLAHLNSSFAGGENDVFCTFSCSTPPKINLQDYLERLTSNLDKWRGEGRCGVRALIMSLVYVERIYRLYPMARLSSNNVHKLLLVSMLAATKFTEDRRLSHQFWAKVGGVDTEELNKLELEFCKLMCFDFYIPKSEFRSCNLDRIASVIERA